MATTTKKRFSTRRPGTPPEWQERTVLRTSIEVPPGNPRREFDPDALDQLAASIRERGLLQRLVVRPKPLAADEPDEGKLLLVAGERRLRACELAGVDMVPVRCAELDEQEAVEIRMIENLLRSDLSAIEEAEGFRELLALRDCTQTELAETLCCSQPRIANALRLLKLPEAWRERIISQVIQPTHCRALLKYVDHPAILAAIEEEFFGSGDTAEIGSREQFAEVVEDVAQAVTSPLFGEVYSPLLGRDVPVFSREDYGDDEYERLAVVTVGGKPRAANVELWTQLQDDHERRMVEDIGGAADLADDEPGEPDDSEQSADPIEDVDPDALVEAYEREEIEPDLATSEASGNDGIGNDDAGDVRQSKAAEKRMRTADAKDPEKRLAEDIAIWRANWLRYLLAEALAENYLLCLRAVLLHLFRKGAGHDSQRIVDAIDPLTAEEIKGPGNPSLIAGCVNPGEVVAGLVPEWFWRDDEPVRVFADQDVELLAQAARIDLEQSWRGNLAGPLSSAFFNLHSRSQLERLAAELGAISTGGQVTKSGIVLALQTDPQAKANLPLSIRKVGE